MSSTATALLVYILWMLVLLGILASLRTYYTLTGKKAVNSFSVDGADVSAFSNRLCRAHANCYESFPIIGGLLILAMLTNTTSITDPLAMIVVGARIGQSVVHLISTNAIAVYARFGFFLVQVGISAYWVIRMLQG